MDENKLNNWHQLSAFMIGLAICFPILLVGHTLTQKYGVTSAITAIVLGNLVLMGLGWLIAWHSACSKKYTSEWAIEIFGLKGRYLFSGALVLSYIGWFGIQLNLISYSVASILGGSVNMYNIVLGLLMMAGGLKDMRALSHFAYLSIPLLLATLGICLYNSSQITPVVMPEQTFTLAGVSLVISAFITAIIDLPTFFLTTKSRKDSMIATFVIFGLAVVLIESFGIYLFVHGQGSNFIHALTINSSIFWQIWVTSFIVLAGWTTNNANLYGSSVNSGILFTKISKPIRTIVISFIGIGIACTDSISNLIEILNWIGITLGAMGAVMAVYFISKHKNSHLTNFVTWLVGLLSGILSITGFGLLQIPVLDAFITAIMIASTCWLYTYLRLDKEITA